jgi:phosphonate transport system ATP-binding protein
MLDSDLSCSCKVAMYDLESITKIYPQGRSRIQALSNVSLQVGKGEQIALLGPSGAGKSTLFRLLNATIRPTGGSLLFEGKDLASMNGAQIRSVRRRIGTIYQQHNLVPSLTVVQNTLCGALGRWSLAHTVRGMFRPDRNDLEKALSALESVGLADKRDAHAGELSGGQQQRVAIARALMQDPDIILADEPVASLDPRLADEIMDLLMGIASESKRTLMVSLHKVEVALQRLPRVVALRDGAVEFDGASADVSESLLKELYKSAARSVERESEASGFRHEFNCLS